MSSNFKDSLFRKIRQSLSLEDISLHVKQSTTLLIENYLNEHLFSNPKYQLPDKLNKFEFQAFSQFGEDGIIEEIFNRIGKNHLLNTFG